MQMKSGHEVLKHLSPAKHASIPGPAAKGLSELNIARTCQELATGFANAGVQAKR
jgi:hypothetical protein